MEPTVILSDGKPDFHSSYRKPVWDTKVEKADSGVMVGYFLPSDLAEKLAMEGGEASEDLHVTILYLGKDLEDEAIERAKEAVARMSRYAAIQGTIGGRGRFPATSSSDNQDVIIRMVDVPRLEALREELIEDLREIGIEPVLNHGYTPHITLGYVGQDFEGVCQHPEELSFAINELTVAVGDWRESFPLNGEKVLKAQPTASMVHSDKPLGDEEEEEDLEKREYSKEYLDAVLAKVKSHLPKWLYKELHKIARSSAGGKARARYRREAMADLGEEFAVTEQEPEELGKDLDFQVVEKKEDKRQVFGWALVSTHKDKPVVDRQGDVVSSDDMEKMAYSFVLKSRVAGEMHRRKGIGDLIESAVLTKEKQKAMGIELPDGQEGWWTGWQIRDEKVWKKLKDGEYTALSIHGRGHRTPIKE